MYKKCPKCDYERKLSDTGDAGVCPACGIVFVKWLRTRAGLPAREEMSAEDAIEESPGPLQALRQRLIYVPDRTDPILFWGRVAVFVGLFIWGWYFISLSIHTGEIGGSFLHNINLAFHEAGHVVFRPFGWFMTVLGGSLGQLIMPMIVMGAFLWHRNAFGASVALWWLGQSLMDLGPYINDARTQQLQLTGGGTGFDRPGDHDWNNILGYLNLLHRDYRVAWWADAIGSAILLLGLAWGGYVLYRQFKNLP